MPNIGGIKFPYTKEGIEAAKKKALEMAGGAVKNVVQNHPMVKAAEMGMKADRMAGQRMRKMMGQPKKKKVYPMEGMDTRA